MRRPVLIPVAALLLVALLLLLLLLLLLTRSGPSPDAVPAVNAPHSSPARGEPPPSAPPPASVLLPGPRPEEPPVAIGKEGDFRIHGRVVDGGGTGVAGAGIEVRAWSGEDPEVRWTILRSSTTGDGSFSLRVDRSLAARGFGIETAAEGFLEGWVSLKLPDYDEARGVEVRVEPARAVVGRVVDEYARPIPNSTVQLWYGSETTWPTTVDADGRFRTPARAPRRAFDLIVEAPGYPRRTIPIPAAPAEESTDVGDLVFRRGGRLAGIAVDPEGRPVPGIPLCLTGIAGNSPVSTSTQTDDAGRFEFTDLGEGVVGVCVDRPGTARDAAGNQRSYRGGLDEVAVGRTDLKVILTADTTVILRFVDAATGAPVLVTKSEFGVWPAGTPEPARPGRGTSSSDPFGSERLTVASGARYDALVRSPGFEDARVAGFDVPDVAEVTVDVPMRRSR